MDIAEVYLGLTVGDDSTADTSPMSRADQTSVFDADQIEVVEIAGTWASYAYKKYNSIDCVIIQNTHSSNSCAVVWYDATTEDYFSLALRAGKIAILPNVRCTADVDLQIAAQSAFTATVVIIGSEG